MSYLTHSLRSLDTLPLLAEKYLGASSRWSEIVSINKLRAPFISDDPYDQLNSERGHIFIGTDLQVGATRISFDNADIISGRIPHHVLKPGAVLFIKKYLANGDTAHDSIRIKSYFKFTNRDSLGDVAPKSTVEFDTPFIDYPRISAVQAGLIKRKVYFSGIWSESGAGDTGQYYNAGDLLVDTIYKTWRCTAAGSPGTWQRITESDFGNISTSRQRGNPPQAARYYVKYTWIGNNTVGLAHDVLRESAPSPFSESYSSFLEHAEIRNVTRVASTNGTFIEYTYDLYPQSMDGLFDASGVQTMLLSASTVQGIYAGKIGAGTVKIRSVLNDHALVSVSNTNPGLLDSNEGRPVAGFVRSIEYSPASYIPESAFFSSNEFMIVAAPSVWPDGVKGVAVYVGNTSTSLLRLNAILTKPGEMIEEPDGGFSYAITSVTAGYTGYSPPTVGLAYQGISNAYTTGTKMSFHDNPDLSESRVLKTGDLVLVPNVKGVSSTQQRSLYKEDITDIWGKDIYLDKSGQVSFNGGSGLDLRGVTGRYNVVQALYNRLQTPYKSLSTQPGFGNLAANRIGSKYSPDLLGEVQAGIIETLLDDQRIFSVESISVSYSTETSAILVNNLTIKLSETGVVVNVTPLAINI